MPEHNARALVRGLVLSLSPGRFVCAQRLVALPAFMAHHSGVVLQPASQKRPDSELLTANSVRALSFVCTSLSLVASQYSGYAPLR